MWLGYAWLDITGVVYDRGDDHSALVRIQTGLHMIVDTTGVHLVGGGWGCVWLWRQSRWTLLDTNNNQEG